MSEDEHVDFNDSPFTNLWDKEKKEEPKSKDFFDAETLKTKMLEGELANGALSGQYFDKKAKFQPAILSKDLQKHYDIVTLKDNDDIYIYNTAIGLYENNGRKTIREKVKNALGIDYQENYAKAVIDDITASTYIGREEFTTPIQLIPVQNGILDISQNPAKLMPHDKKYYFTNQLPIKYTPEAKSPKFLKFHEEILPEEKFRMQIQEMFGWCLWRDYHQQVAFMLIGEGSNGRSTLLGVLRCLLGEHNITAQPLQELCGNRFATAELYKKFANIAPDIPGDKIMDSSSFKTLTGGDALKAERKFCNPFNFVNYAKLIFSANKLPYSSDKTYAYYRRWMLIFFNIKFGDDGNKVNKHILEEITTPEEMSGVLNWALEGLRRLNEHGDFTGRLSVEETRKYYDRLVSPAYTFVSDCITETDKSEDYIPKDYLWNVLIKYCEKNHLPKPTSQKQIAGIIKRNFRNVKPMQRTVDKPHTYVWSNCKFSDAKMDLEYNEWLVKVGALKDEAKETPQTEFKLENAFANQGE